MKVFSNVTKRSYSDVDAVYIVNPQQAWAYLHAGADLVDLYPRDDKRIVFVFDKTCTADLYKQWCEHAL